jgi:hypothetical protein
MPTMSLYNQDTRPKRQPWDADSVEKPMNQYQKEVCRTVHG